MERLMIIKILLLSFALSSIAWPVDREKLYELLNERKLYPCPHMRYNAQLLIPRLYNEGKIDSVYMIIDYYQSVCNVHEFNSLEMILNIENGRFEDNWRDSALIGEMLNRDYNSSCIIWNSDLDDYWKFKMSLAEKVASKTEPDKLAHALCKYYAGDQKYIMKRLRQNKYPNTSIQDAYNLRIEDLEKNLRKTRLCLGFYYGIWVPIGPIDVLGVKNDLGFQLGGFKNRLRYFGNINFRSGKARNSYDVYHNQSTITTDHFSGSSMSMTFAYEFLKGKRSGIEGICGVGFDMLIATDFGKDNDNVVLRSPLAFFGLNYRLYFDRFKTGFANFELCYNIIDLDNDRGTNLSGDAVTFRLTLGLQRPIDNTYEFDRLCYFE
ncbi:MAG: hypothetical protein GY839_04845 [candidate division Zixibacteria bacterium]|nr:hypothetical protein [candidate division Zixibacteria bacterium]